MKLHIRTEAHIKTHARRSYPRECCGLVQVIKGKELYTECKNISEGEEHFIMDPKDYLRAERNGDITAIVHSHPNFPPIPSQADKVSMSNSGLPWVIVNWPVGNIQIHEPDNYEAPLIGRQFSHGILDCYSCVKDAYKELTGIIIPDFERTDKWWDRGEDLYLKGFEKAGFKRVYELQKYDGILMQICSNQTNHAAIYLGDNIILHHVIGRISCREVYGGYWKKSTTHIVRHDKL